ncbi:hypothetical protein ACFLT7_03545 [candidate division KSB1 bacterium]
MNTSKSLFILIILAAFVVCTADKPLPEEIVLGDRVTIYLGGVAVEWMMLDDDIGISFVNDITQERKDALERSYNLTFVKIYAVSPYTLIHYKINGEAYEKSKIISKDPLVNYAVPVFYSEKTNDCRYIEDMFTIRLSGEGYFGEMNSLNGIYGVSIIAKSKGSKTYYSLKINRPDLYNAVELSLIYMKKFYILAAAPSFYGGRYAH